MPWKRTDPMEERMRLVMEVESEVFQMSELCERYGVSRKTGYKWLERYRKEGVAGLQDRSRAPLHCPHRTPEAIGEVLIKARHSHPYWGGGKLVDWLQQRQPEVKWPAAARSYPCAPATGRGGSPRSTDGRLQGRVSYPGSTLLLSANNRRLPKPVSAGLSSLLLDGRRAGPTGLSGDFPRVWAAPGDCDG